MYLQWLQTEGERFATAVETGPPSADVATCPGWTVYDLAAHLGNVHRWAATAARTGDRPRGDEQQPPDSEQIGAWYRAELAELCDALSKLDPAAPTWHPFPVGRVGAVWPRRQAHETTMHRWDAQRAIGATPDPIDAALASDGIDELFSVVIPRIVSRTGATTPQATLHLHCTDVDGEWLVWTDGDDYQFRREHAKGDAAVRGPASDLLLYMYKRLEEPSDDMQIFGDDAAVAAWRSLPGF